MCDNVFQCFFFHFYFLTATLKYCFFLSFIFFQKVNNTLNRCKFPNLCKMKILFDFYKFSIRSYAIISLNITQQIFFFNFLIEPKIDRTACMTWHGCCSIKNFCNYKFHLCAVLGMSLFQEHTSMHSVSYYAFSLILCIKSHMKLLCHQIYNSLLSVLTSNLVFNVCPLLSLISTQVLDCRVESTPGTLITSALVLYKTSTRSLTASSRLVIASSITSFSAT